MKHLFAIRHAFPCAKYQGPDHDRPLGEQGLHDCEVIGLKLKSQDVKPDIFLSSTAFRALTTAERFASYLDYPKENIVTSRTWYLAPAGTWMKAVQQINEEAGTAMIFGHNPGMADFARNLNRENQTLSFSPLTIAHFELDVSYWGEVSPASGHLVEVLAPQTS